MANISDQFASELMAHSIDLAHFEAGQRDVALKLFRDLEAQLILQLQRHAVDEPTLSTYQLQRTEKLLAYVRPIIAATYRDLYFSTRRELHGLALTEVSLTQELGAELVVDGLFSVGVPEATLKAMVNDLILEGKPLREWWSRQASTTLQRYGDTVRQGLLRGDATNNMVRALRGTRERSFEDGVFGRSRRDITTLVRTSVQSVANESRLQTFRNNADVLRGMEWLVAQDHVCPICIPLSGQTWTLEGRRLPGTKLAFTGAPPRHPNCRCQLIPLVLPYRDLTQAKGSKFADEVKALPEETKTALDGGNGVDLTFNQWLKTQPVARQREILGPGRYKLWNSGKLSLTGLVNAATGRALTLEQLTAARRRRRVA